MKRVDRPRAPGERGRRTPGSAAGSTQVKNQYARTRTQVHDRDSRAADRAFKYLHASKPDSDSWDIKA